MTSLSQVTTLHQLAETWEGDRILVEHPAVEEFSAGVGRLLVGLGDQQQEDFWAGMARPLKRLRWLIATTPLPVNHPANGVQSTVQAVAPRLRRTRQFAPALASEAEALADVLEQLAACDDDPLGDAVRNAAAGSPFGVVLLVVDGRSVAAVAEAFGDFYRVLTTPQLLRTKTARAVAIGPCSWFPPELIRAPRAERLSFAYFGWLRDRDPQTDLLVGSETSRSALRGAPPRSPSRIVAGEPAQEEAAHWIPAIEWHAIAQAARSNVDEGHGEPVPAQLLLLVSGDGVYLEAKEGAQAYVADLEDEISVRQERISSLREGMFLIVRTAGEGDYIRELADSLLGETAPHLRELQTRWKEKLNEKVDRIGARAVGRRLTELGATRASEENVRRWASADNIRTQDPADFAAICELVGEPFEELWKAMSDIFAAHQQAGNEVRKLLVDEIRKADSAALLQLGWSDYDVEGIKGEGALRVARIAGRSTEVVSVPRGRLKKPFKVSENLWLG
jgi:hypothetical protein